MYIYIYTWISYWYCISYHINIYIWNYISQRPMYFYYTSIFSNKNLSIFFAPIFSSRVTFRLNRIPCRKNKGRWSKPMHLAAWGKSHHGTFQLGSWTQLPSWRRWTNEYPTYSPWKLMLGRWLISFWNGTFFLFGHVNFRSKAMKSGTKVHQNCRTGKVW